MRKPHYVEYYESLVARLRSSMPLAAAMEAAVGGDSHTLGRLERRVLEYAGLTAEMHLVDVGCGSGHLATNLRDWPGYYLGVDVVQDLLDYAAANSRLDFEFCLSLDLTIPCPDNTQDLVCFFSVFTHLTQIETYRYLSEASRILKPGGRAVFSFLDPSHAAHWQMFLDFVAEEENGSVGALNTLLDKSMIAAAAKHLNLAIVELVPGQSSPWRGSHFGQSVAILEKLSEV